MMNYLWTLLIGLAGALIAVKLRLPAGALVGSMVAVGLVNVWGAIPIPTPPAGIRFVMQWCWAFFWAASSPPIRCWP